MTVANKTLYTLLLDSGHSEEFVDYAMTHQHFYQGNLEKFVDYINHLRQDDALNETRAETNPSTLSDSGSRRAEHDYMGDNLTHGGYDHTDQNRRW